MLNDVGWDLGRFPKREFGVVLQISLDGAMRLSTTAGSNSGGSTPIYVPDIRVNSPMNQFLDQFPILEVDCKVEKGLTLFIHCCQQPRKIGKTLES